MTTCANMLNKERAVFIAAAAMLALAVFSFTSSGPFELSPGQPITQSAAPEAPQPVVVPDQKALSFYREHGALNPETNARVNRARKSPFQPPGSAPVLVRADDPIRHGPPAEGGAQTQEAVQPSAPVDIASAVSFMGVVHKDSAHYGLLRPLDGSPPLRIKVGDKVGIYDYVVTKITPQEIWVEDSAKRRYVLKDRL